MKYPKMSMGFSESHHRSDDGEMKASSLMPFISDRMASASFCPDSAQLHDVFDCLRLGPWCFFPSLSPSSPI